MQEINNSRILAMLLDHARQNGASDESITAERFFMAVLDFVEGSTPFTDLECRKKLEELLQQHKVNIPQAKSSLAAYLSENGDAALMDSMYMQRMTYNAKLMARQQSLPELTPEMLLRSILEEPTEGIRKSLTPPEASQEQGSAPQTEEGGLSKAVLQGLNRTLQDILQQSGQEQKNTPSPAPATPRPEPATSPAPYENPRQAVAHLTEKVKEVRQKLLGTIYGQDNAVNVFTTGYFQAELLAMTDKNRVRPRATFLFAGPPGVGKTFLAEQAAQALGLPFMRFDMSEYSDKEANLEFCGFDNVYKNSKPGNVTSFVSANPRCVLLFDEIEKAHINIIHLFLQILDAGRLRDNYTDKEVPFSDTILIFTTNAGRQLYEDSESGDLSGLSRKVILKALQKDNNPATGVSYFPGAICSRFASGNVVMFNHIAAHHLRQIVKNEVLRHAGNFQREIGIEVNIDESVYSALLFAEGGTADARTMRSRGETFFDDELFELFRLMGVDDSRNGIEQLQRIHIGVDLSHASQELLELFKASETPEAIVFASPEVCTRCEEQARGCRIFGVQTVDAAVDLLRKRDIRMALVDMGRRGTAGHYLNIEDEDSASRDFLRYLREKRSNLPVYLLQSGETILNTEEKLSFLRSGVRDVVSLNDEEHPFGQTLEALCGYLHQQHSMETLARANRVVSYETAQTISEDGTQADITLFDFATSTAVDPEDGQNILSSVSRPDVHFDQVIGAEDAKKELRYFVQYLKNPKKYLGTGVASPRGVILYGPPGTGKTMLAKAMACESGVTFISAEGNQFMAPYVGQGEQKVHEIFRTARKYAPSIIFVDEIDAIAKERKGGEFASANGEDILTAFLAEMDGFKKDATKPVFVLAATNFDVEAGRAKSLDPALMRRFDRRVYVDLPNREERIRFIRQKIAANPAFALSDAMVENLAIRSTGMSLASLESAMELALRSVLRSGDFKVTDAVMEESFETFNSGEAKKWDVAQLERVARHEAGHTFLCWQGGETPSYVTIVARGDYGGYMQHDDNEGKALFTRDELLTRIRTSLGGRASEIVYYGEEDGLSTGASGDLVNATRLAQQIICSYGMDDAFGLAVITPEAAHMGETSSAVRQAVNQILASQMEKAVQLMRAYKPCVDALVAELMRKNHLTGEEIDNILRAAMANLKADA